MAGKTIEVGSELEILKQDFVAIINITEDFRSDKQGRKIKKYDYLFSPKEGCEPGTITINEIVEQFNGFLEIFGQGDAFKEGDFENELEPYKGNSNDGLGEIKITVDQAFVYYSVEEYQENSNNNDNDELKKTFYYAFQLSINTEKAIPKFQIFNFKKLSFAVWNCDYPKITEKLHIYNIKDFIE